VYYAVFDVEGISVVRGIRSHTPQKASTIAQSHAESASLLTGREWQFKKLRISFPDSLVYDSDSVTAMSMFSKRFQIPRER
jgi:hypothetical protein